jgi:hypothetical protein
LKLYLLAGLQEQALTVANRWLGAVSPTDTIERAATISRIVRNYRQVSPIDWRTLRAFLDQLDPVGKPWLVWQIWHGIHIEALVFGSESDREYWISQYREPVLTLFKKLPDSSIPPKDGEAIRGVATSFDLVLQHRNLMDSLSKSTATYLKTLNSVQAVYRGGLAVSDANRNGRGEAIPKLEGDFVFPKSDTPAVFPRPGKATLFYTMSDGDTRGSVAFFARSSQLRRLKQRFPALDIVLVMATRGAVVPLAPPSPVEEAEFFSTLLKWYNVPATLVVHNSPYFHLPDPDRRRVAEPLTRGWDPRGSPDVAFVVDRNGMLVEQIDLLGNTKAEKTLTDLVQAVLKQD